MTRLLLVFGCVFALALTTMGNDADARKRRGSASSCVMSGMDGKQTKWRCGRGQKCCYDWFMSKGTCVPRDQICL
jgi:hypothetical protein